MVFFRRWHRRARSSQIPRMMLERPRVISERYRARRFPRFVATLLPIIVIAFLLLAASPLFAIRQITIRADDTIAGEEVWDVITSFLKERRMLVFPQQQLFLIDTRALAERILKLPSVKAITIFRRLPRTLELFLAMRSPELVLGVLPKAEGGGEEGTSFKVLLSAGTYTTVDEDGFRIRALSLPTVEGEEAVGVREGDDEMLLKLIASITGRPVVFLQDASGYPVGSTHILSPETSHFLIHLADALEKIPSLEVRSLSLETASSGEVRARTAKGFEILFSRGETIRAQLDATQRIIGKGIVDESSLSYLDVRIPDRVYYK